MTNQDWLRRPGEHRVCVDLRMPDGVSKELMIAAIEKAMEALCWTEKPGQIIAVLAHVRDVIKQLPDIGGIARG